MKKILLLLIPVFFVSCTTYNSSNSYYGYDNSQEVIDEQDLNDGDEWQNPLASNNEPDQVQRVQNSNKTQYNGPQYVPVIVPWWNGYYGWGNMPRRRAGVSVYYTNYWGPEWYSPWYSYHPYYGVTWYDYWYVRPHHRHWQRNHIPSYTDRPIRRNQPRDAGNSRGTYSVYNPRNNTRAVSNTRTYNPRTERYTSNGENVFRRDGNYEVRSGNRSNSNSNRSNSSSSRPSYSQPDNNNGKSSTSTSKSSNSRGSSSTSKSSSSRSSSSKSSSSRSSGGSRSGGSRSGNSRGK